MPSKSIEAVARSLVLKCTGLSANEADRKAGEEFRFKPRTVAVYRKRMRERLEGGETRLQRLQREGRICRRCNQPDAPPSSDFCGFCEEELRGLA